MLVFATSDKGGTGRSVTSANILFRRALAGSDVAYLDFDFGSPTAGMIFDIESVEHGTTRGGMHSYLRGQQPEPHRLDVWDESERENVRGRPDGAGQLVLLPGDRGGGEFAAPTPDTVRRCVRLLLRLHEEFDICLLDLSAGRSFATEVALAATAQPELSHLTARWLVFHRWTRQHVNAAHELVSGRDGIIETGVQHGHDKHRLTDSIRFVRTAVVNPDSHTLAGLRAEQIAWLRYMDRELNQLAGRRDVGRTKLLGSVPLDPVLQWREQLITDWDIAIRQIANRATVEAFESIAARLDDERAWVTL